MEGVAVEVQDLEVAQALEAGTYFLLCIIYMIHVYFGTNQIKLLVLFQILEKVRKENCNGYGILWEFFMTSLKVWTFQP